MEGLKVKKDVKLFRLLGLNRNGKGRGDGFVSVLRVVVRVECTSQGKVRVKSLRKGEKTPTAKDYVGATWAHIDPTPTLQRVVRHRPYEWSGVSDRNRPSVPRHVHPEQMYGHTHINGLAHTTKWSLFLGRPFTYDFNQTNRKLF